ncbi:hypothetical protein ABIA32_003359 [Streptacidiphilus sp. MAP12-20]
MAWVRERTAESLTTSNNPEHPQVLHRAVLAPRRHRCPAPEPGAGGGLGIGGVTLADPAASGPIGTVHVTHDDALGRQVTAQGGPLVQRRVDPSGV